VRYILCILILCCSSLLASCGGSSTPTGYLNKTNDSAIFLQFTQKNGQITGSIQDFERTNDTPPSIRSFNEAMTGTENSSSLTITISYFGMTQSFTGTDNGNTLNLAFPQQDGSMQTVTFTSASINDYNQAVSAIRAQVTKEDVLYHNNQATVTANQATEQAVTDNQDATATAVANEQQAVSADNTQVRNDMQTLKSDSNTLTSFSETDTLNGYANDWQTMQNDYATEQKDANNGCGESNINADQVQTDADQVDTDKDQIDTDDDQFNSDTDQYNNDLQPVNTDITQLKQDWAQLQKDTQANSSGTPAPAYSSDDITGAIQNGNDAIGTAQGVYNNAQTSIKQYDQKSTSLQNTAYALPAEMNCS
jgi:hypothetical protein